MFDPIAVYDAIHKQTMNDSSVGWHQVTDESIRRFATAVAKRCAEICSEVHAGRRQDGINIGYNAIAACREAIEKEFAA